MDLIECKDVKTMGMELKFLLVSIPFLGVLLFEYKRLYEYYKWRAEINNGLSLSERDNMFWVLDDIYYS